MASGSMFACSPGQPSTDPAGLQVFQPTLLDDLDGLDPAFDGWLEEQRQRVKQLALSVTEAVLAAASETKARIVAAERLLTIDRVHEGAWQALIRAHLELGNRAAARLAFERCSTTLSYAGLLHLARPRHSFAARRSAPEGPKPRAAGKAIRLCVMHPRALDGSGMDALVARPGRGDHGGRLTLPLDLLFRGCFAREPDLAAAA